MKPTYDLFERPYKPKNVFKDENNKVDKFDHNYENDETGSKSKPFNQLLKINIAI